MKDTSRFHRGSSGHGLAVTLAVMGFIGLLGWPARAGEPAKEPRKVHLRVLYSNTLFSNVNRNDALAALRVWIDTLGRNRGLLLQTEVDSFGRLEEADKRIQENAVDLIVFDTVQYLRTTQAEKLDPKFTAGGQKDKAPDDYVLVARRDRNSIRRAEEPSA